MPNSFERLADVVAEAKAAGQRVKEECSKSIDTAIRDLTQAVYQIRGEALPESGIFSRFKTRWSQKRRIKQLVRKIDRLEKTKLCVEGALVDSYSDAEKLTERTIADIRELYDDADLGRYGGHIQSLVSNIKAVRREFREKVYCCSYELDRDLQQARDEEGADQSAFKKLMRCAAFGECQKLSHLESLNNKARLLGVAVPLAATAESEGGEPSVVEHPVEELTQPDIAADYVMPVFSDEVANTPVEPVAPAFEKPLEVEEESSYAVAEHHEEAPTFQVPLDVKDKPEEVVLHEEAEEVVPEHDEVLGYQMPLEVKEEPEEVVLHEEAEEVVPEHDEVLGYQMPSEVEEESLYAVPEHHEEVQAFQMPLDVKEEPQEVVLHEEAEEIPEKPEAVAPVTDESDEFEPEDSDDDDEDEDQDEDEDEEEKKDTA